MEKEIMQKEKEKPILFNTLKFLLGFGLLIAVFFVAFVKIDMPKVQPKVQPKAQKVVAQLQAPQRKQDEKRAQRVEVKAKSNMKEKSKAVAKAQSPLFPAEKILTISALEYCENHGKNIEDYEMVGVHGYSNYLFDRKDLLSGRAKHLYDSNNLPNLIIRRIPPGAEVVVGLTFSGDDAASGVAMIPKQKSQKSKSQSAIKKAGKKEVRKNER